MADDRWLQQRMAMARMAQQAPPARPPIPAGGRTPTPQRGVVTRPSWDQIVGARKPPPAPSQGPANGAKGLIGKVFGNPIVRGAMKPLEVLDAPRRAVTALAAPVVSQFAPGAVRSENQKNIWEAIKDPSYGSKQAFGVDNPILAFGVDTALDPLTYVSLGSGEFAGAGGRIAAATAAAEKGLEPGIVAKLAREGVTTADDATRAALGLENRGLHFAGMQVPGTGTVGKALGRATTSARLGVMDTRVGNAVRRGFAGNKDGLAELRVALQAGTVEDPTRALSQLAASDAKRAARSTLSARLQNDAVRVIREPDVQVAKSRLTDILEGSVPAASAEERSAARKMRAFFDRGRTEANARGAQIADRYNYVPHVVSDAAREAWAGGDQRLKVLTDDLGRMQSIEHARSREVIQKILGEEPRSWTISGINDVSRRNLGYDLLESDVGKLTEKWIGHASEAVGDNAAVNRLRDFGVAKPVGQAPAQDPNAVANLQRVLAEQQAAAKTAKGAAAQAGQAAEQGVTGAESAAQGLAAGLEREVLDARNAMPGLEADRLAARRGVGEAAAAQQQARAGATRLIPNEALQSDLTTAAEQAALKAGDAKTSLADLQGLAEATGQEARVGRMNFAMEEDARRRAAAKMAGLSRQDKAELTSIEGGRGVREGGDLTRVRNARGKGVKGGVEMGDARTPISETRATKAGAAVQQRSLKDSVSASRSATKADENLWGSVENMPATLRDAHGELTQTAADVEKAQRVLAKSQRNTRFDERALRTTSRSRGAKVLEVNPTELPKFNEHISNQLATYLQFTEDYLDAAARLPEGASKEALHQAEVHAHQLRKQAARLLGLSENSSFAEVSDMAEEALRAGASVAQRPAVVLGGEPGSTLSTSLQQAAEAERKHLAALQRYQITSEYHARVRAAEEWAAAKGVALGPDTHLRIAQRVTSEQAKILQDAQRSTQASLADFLDKAGKAVTRGGQPKFDPAVVDLVRGAGAVSAEPYAELRQTIQDTAREYERLRKAAARKTLTEEQRAELAAQRELSRQSLVDLSAQASTMLRGVDSGTKGSLPTTVGKAWADKLGQAETLLREQAYRLKPVRDQVTQILRDSMATNKGIQNQLSTIQARLRLAAGSDFGPDDIAQLLEDHLRPELLMTNPQVAQQRILDLTAAETKRATYEQRLPEIVARFQALDEKVAEMFSPGGGWAKLNVREDDLQAIRQILADPEYQSAKRTLADMEREIDALRFKKVQQEVGRTVEKPSGGTEFVPTGTQEVMQQEIPAVSRFAANAGLGREGAPRPRTWEQAQRYAEGALEIRNRYNAPELIQRVADQNAKLNEYLDLWAKERPARIAEVDKMKRARASELAQWTNHLNVIEEQAKKADSLVMSTGATDQAGAFERLASAIDEAQGRAPKERYTAKPVTSTITSDEMLAAQQRAAAAGDKLGDAARQAEQLQKKADRARAQVVAMDHQAAKERASWAKGVKDADDLHAKARANYDAAATLQMDAQDWTDNVAPRLERMWDDQVKAIIQKPGSDVPIQDRLEWAQKTAKVSDLIRTAQGNPTQENMAIAKLAADLHTAELDAAGADYVANVTKHMISEAKRGRLYTKMVDQVEEGWVQLERSGLQVPKEVDTAMRNFRRPGVESKFWETVGKYNMVFKALATTTPGFHIRNALSATFMNMVDGVDFRTMGLGARHMQRYAENPSTWTRGMSEAERNLAERALDAAYATGAGQFADELRGLDEMKGITGKIANNRITRASRNAGHRIETAARYSMALDTLKKGGSWDQAVARIRRFHFDYENIGQYDEAIKKIIPFWMFTSRNVPMQMQTMWLKPRWYSIYDNFRRNMALGNDSVVPSYIEQEGGFKVGNGMYLSPDLPQMRLGETFAKIADPKRALADASPLFRVPAELAAGKRFYNDVPFRQDDTRTPLVDESRTPVEGWDRLLAPLYAATGQLNGQGVTDKGRYAVQSLVPTLGQGARLAPTEDKYRERQLASWASYLGVPLRQVGPQAIASETRRRALAASGR